MQSLLVNQSPVSELTYSNTMRVIYNGVEQDAELRKYPSGKVYFRTENAHFVPVGEVGMLIPLTKGMNAIVDFEDYEKVAERKWHYDGRYAASRRSLNGRYFKIYLHRFLFDFPFEMHIDHIDGEKLNNQKCNLRLCSASGNMKNRARQSNNKSGYKGVSWHKGDQKWRVQIRFDRNRIGLGTFADIHTAARVYNEAALKYHGEFAVLNNIKQN